ncbi:expressed unknown protein [Seminavis robusta]|uniref:Uncharacterized protein n=1 Tax=Seminavis robusta TaxID=568900 RepID=A0A9N8DNQ5_9STRA|nr:expressed unknown protein [Seminavis robusta]|eukprot:Sro240_g096140.1 n/a (381) ;mRNA; f:55508-56650
MPSSEATRKSIKKYFGLGGLFAMGNNGPFTMHDVDPDLFPTIWSFIAEVLETEVGLNRLVMEELSIFYSKKNDCPICIFAHTLLEEAAKAVDDEDVKISSQARAYAETVYMATTLGEPIPDTDQLVKMYPDLSETNRAEIAIVLLVYQYMNRVVRALLGEHVSTAMFGIPRPVAAVVENENGYWFYKKVLKPILSQGMKKKGEPGITLNLFPKEAADFELPFHLADAELAGHERARSLARLYSLIDKLYNSKISKIVSSKVIAILDDPDNQAPKGVGTTKYWAMVHMPDQVFKKQLSEKIDQRVAQVLLLIDIMPDALMESSCWKKARKQLGDEQARLIVFWWALRCTLVMQAKGLTPPGDEAGTKSVTEFSEVSDKFYM